MTKVFHYAPWAYLPRIVTSGALLPSNAGAEHEVQILWFSAHQKWEPTACKLRKMPDGTFKRMSFQEQLVSFGCIRFGLAASDLRLLEWKVACSMAGTKREVRRDLERVGRKLGASPSHWFATTQSVPLSELDLEVFGEGAWHPADPEEMAGVWTRNRPP